MWHFRVWKYWNKSWAWNADLGKQITFVGHRVYLPLSAPVSVGREGSSIWLETHSVWNGAFIYGAISTAICCVLMITGWLFITLGCACSAGRTRSFYSFDRNEDEFSVNLVNKLGVQDKALTYCSGGVMQVVGELERTFWLIYAP